MTVHNSKSKVALISGFISAFIGYSFHEWLWYMAFYHLVALAFACYTFALFNETTLIKWRKITFIPFIASLNSLTDEICYNAMVFNWSEYVSLAIIAIYLYYKK